MPIATAPEAGPEASRLKAMGVGDPSKFRTIKGVPILDTHEPIPKRIKVKGQISEANPDGLIDAFLTCDDDDLAAIARNANRMAEMGRPPLIQIGHTPLEQDKPESFFPKPVGMMSHFSVRESDGKPWLCADLHYRVDRIDEASDFPNMSVERINWHDNDAQTVRAVALLRRKPERDVPMVPYAADEPITLFACYSRDVPAPDPQAPKVRKMALDPDDLQSFVQTIQLQFDSQFESMTQKLVAALKPAEIITTPVVEEPAPMADKPVETNYDGGGSMGPNTGYVPGMIPADNDDAKRADYVKACLEQANYASQVPGLVSENTALKTEVASLKTLIGTVTSRLDKMGATVEQLNQDSEMAVVREQQANYNRRFDDLEREGVIFTRAQEFEQLLALPVDKRDTHFERMEAHYQRSAVGRGMIPGPARSNPAGPDERQQRLDYMTKHGIKDYNEGVRRFNAAKQAGETI